MAEISQTESEIKIIIKFINSKSRRPDVMLLRRYVKFNCPPTFFEAHLTDDVDEEKSYCKLFKKEARIFLKKVNQGIWENICDIPNNKETALEKRKEMVDILQKKNVEIEKEAVKKLDIKKKTEIEREIERESKIREKIEVANEKLLKNELGVTPEQTKEVKEKIERERKKQQRNFKSKFIKEEQSEEFKKILEQEKKEKEEELKKQAKRNEYIGPKINKQEANVVLQKKNNQQEIRKGGSIKISFTKFDFKTPKRESQKSIQDDLLKKKSFENENTKNNVEEKVNNSVD